VNGAHLWTRARHWARWQRGRAQWAMRHDAHLDLAPVATSVWICSWQRSGSTWVAEVLASPPRTRLIYEPANLPGRLYDGATAALSSMPEGPGPELDAVERALHGRVRGRWVDQLSTTRLVARRVVKDVRAMGLLGMVAARQPSVPIVALVRHPLAVASSAVALGWTDRPDAPVAEQLLGEVRRWSDVHSRALRSPAARQAMVVAYEHAVLDPRTSFEGILAHLGAHHATWRGVQLDEARLLAPSATSFRRAGSRSASEWIGTFEGIDPGVVAEASAIIADAGLGALYGQRPEPLVEPGAVRDALAAR